MTHLTGSLQELSRISGWWRYKISYLFLPLYFALPIVSGGLAEAVYVFYYLLGYFLSTAAVGHLINDYSDVRSDRLAGKVNAQESHPTFLVVLLVLLCLAVSFAMLILAGASELVLWLAVLELLFFLSYSCRPLRLKESPFGVVLDSGYAHVIPFAIAGMVVSKHLVEVDAFQLNLIVAVLAWQFLSGVRGILRHQLDDYSVDVATGCKTAAVRFGRKKTERFHLWVVTPLEGVLLLTVIVLMSSTLPVMSIGLIVYSAGYFIIRRSLRDDPYTETSVGELVDDFLDRYYRAYLPLVLLGGALVLEPAFWPLLLLHGMLFNLPHAEKLIEEKESMPRAVAVLGLERTGDGKQVLVTGCYLTSQVTLHHGVDLHLSIRANGSVLPVSIDHSSNQFSDFYVKYDVKERPVCFSVEIPVPVIDWDERCAAIEIVISWASPSLGSKVVWAGVVELT